MFSENLQYEELEENLGRDGKNMFIGFAIMSNIILSKYSPWFLIHNL